MASANPRKVQPLLVDDCVNCLVFGWGQPEEVTTLRKCKQCKAVQYCSESCQKEHWNLVYKQQCKKIASAIAIYQEIGDNPGVSGILFSHHPFSASELPGNPIGALVMLAQKVLAKMQFRNQSVFDKVSSQLVQHCSQMGPYLGTRVPIGTFLAFWVPIGSLFIFQGPYFQCFGFIHAKYVNLVCMYTTMS